MRIGGRKLLPAGGLALLLFSAAMVWPLLFAGRIFYFRDFGFFYYPVKRYALGRILSGEFPLWCPEMSCGTPLHGELVHGLLYPPNLLLLAGPALGWGLYFLAHLLLAGLGARRLAARLGAAPDGALAAGIAFAGSGYLVAQMNHVPYATAAAWAPLLLSLLLDLGHGRRATVPLLALGFAAAALAGEPFTLLLTFLFGLVLLAAGLGGPRVPALLKTALAGAIALLLASPALLPALAQVGESVRAAGLGPDPDGFGSLHPLRFLTLLAPEALGRPAHAMELPVRFLGGTVDICPPILLGIHFGSVTLLALLFAPLRSARPARYLAGIALAAALLSLGPHLGLATWLSKTVPGLAVFRYPDKYWLAATLAAAVLAGLALPRLRPAPVTTAASLLAFAAFLAGLATGHLLAGLTGAAGFVLAALAVRLPAPRRTAALTAILAAELLFFGVRMGPVTDPANLGPTNPDGIGPALAREKPGRIFDDYHWPVPEQVEAVTLLRLRNLQSLSGIPEGFSYSIGYDPLEPLARVAKFFKMPADTPSSERNAIWHRLMRLSATTHAITNKAVGEDREVFLPPRLQRHPDVRVLAYRRPLPRARLYGAAVRAADRDEARRLVQDPAFDPFRILVLEGAGETEDAGAPRGEAEFLEDRPERVTLRVTSDRPAWLFLADAYARGWTATVNGRAARIHAAHVAFRAVRVPEGTSEVTFTYRPGWLATVPFTTGAGLLALLLLLWRARRSARGAAG